MEKVEALNKMGLPETIEHEELEHIFEQKLFDLKKDILQKYMVPTLLTKKTQLIQEMMLLEHVLLPSVESQTDITTPQWQSQPTDRIQFLEQYEAQISALKLLLMNCASFDHLLKIVQTFTISQDYYMVLFLMLFNEFSEALPEEVNTREIVDTGKLLLALKKGELDNKQIWEIERELARIEKIQGLRPV